MAIEIVDLLIEHSDFLYAIVVLVYQRVTSGCFPTVNLEAFHGFQAIPCLLQGGETDNRGAALVPRHGQLVPLGATGRVRMGRGEGKRGENMGKTVVKTWGKYMESTRKVHGK